MAGRRKPRRLIPGVMLAAREHRKEPTPAEDQLWMALRDGRLGGMNFRRQHPVGPFILDFYCPKKKLCIEVDGAVHDGQRELDEARTEALGTLKIRVIRFRNEEVLHELPSVLQRITEVLEAGQVAVLPLSPRQFAGGGGRGVGDAVCRVESRDGGRSARYRTVSQPPQNPAIS